ncbi:MAG: putative Ig domain-containing protein [Granulosicoccus sp.]
MKTGKLQSLITTGLAGLVLAACDWVDSGGSSDAPEAPVVVSEILLDDVPVGQAEVINEKTLARFIVPQNTSNLERTYAWSEPLEQGNLPECAGTNGFKPELAASSLDQACTLESDCAFEFVNLAAEPESVPGTTPETVPDGQPNTPEDTTDAAGIVFELRIPALKASVGARYMLEEQDSSGNVFNTEFSICMIAVNEQPDARDDIFVILEGNELNVTPATVNLLSNDSDDIDVSNEPLSVLPEPLSEPENAAVFELGDDGSFTYESNLIDLREDQFDTFTYEVTDGVFTVSAKATIRVVAINQAPRLLDSIEDLSATEDEVFRVDLAPNFFDPESNNLAFTLSDDTPLAAGTGLSLSRAGVLSGTPTASDVGVYELTIEVSDGGQVTETSFTLEVGETNNRAPFFVTGSVAAEITGPVLVIMRISTEFIDPDGDDLTYSMAFGRVLPVGLSLNRATGVISGRPSVAGVYPNLRVRATDPFDKSTLSPAFTITIVGN